MTAVGCENPARLAVLSHQKIGTCLRDGRRRDCGRYERLASLRFERLVTPGGERLSALDDHALAADLAERAGHLLLTLRAGGGDPDALRKAGDRQSHEFLMAELARERPDDAVLSEEGTDDEARLAADRVWIVDPLDGTREFGDPGRTDWAVHVALWARAAAAGKGDLIAGAVALPAQNRVLSTVDQTRRSAGGNFPGSGRAAPTPHGGQPDPGEQPGQGRSSKAERRDGALWFSWRQGCHGNNW